MKAKVEYKDEKDLGESVWANNVQWGLITYDEDMNKVYMPLERSAPYWVLSEVMDKILDS